MTRVQRTFLVVEYIEVAVILVSGIAALMLKQRFALSGVALGLLLNAAVLLTFDLVAERRGAAYLTAIHAQPRGAVAPLPARGGAQSEEAMIDTRNAPTDTAGLRSADERASVGRNS